MVKLLSDEQEKFLYKHYIGVGNDVLLERLNKEFNLEMFYHIKNLQGTKTNEEFSNLEIGFYHIKNLQGTKTAFIKRVWAKCFITSKTYKVLKLLV